jgi:CRISPR-associated protein Csx17
MTTMMTTRQVLPGLTPEPLASYLAGLGLIRVLGEQADASATAAWTPTGMVVRTTLPDIFAWLADEYVPTPVLSPWNGGSGFGAKDKEPVQRIAAIRRHPSPRLTPLREAITAAERVVAKAREQGWITQTGVADKRAVVLEFRNSCPEELIPWIDAAIVLTGSDTQFPPILGTGGNDGRLDFSTNFHEQVLAVVGATPDDRARSLAMARDLLLATQAEQLAKAPIGQFDPGNAGGPGSSRFGAADSLANAWGYVLFVEGALLFAASAVKRNQHAAGRAAVPFTVWGAPDGSASGATGEESRGEVWAPVWKRDFTLAEIRQLFAEARASWRGRPARRAVDFYAATRTLGVARGIDEFTRFGLQRRNGLAFAAVPLDRVRVRERPAVRLAAKVEDWVTRVGGSDASTMVGERYRQFSRAHLEFARDGDADGLARMLAALTALEQAVGRSGRARETVPVRYAPPAGEFLKVLIDRESRELRLAVGIASCATRPLEPRERPPRTMRQLLLPVDPDRWRDAPLVPGFGARPLCDVLADVLIWRSRTAVEDRDAAKFRGVLTFRSSIAVPAADLHTLAKGPHDGNGLDEKKLDLLLRACLALNWQGVRHEWAPATLDSVDLTLGLLHPLASGLKPPASDDGAADEPGLALAPGWAIQLAAGKLSQVHGEAVARLRRAGWDAGPVRPQLAVGDGARIAAALVPRCLRPQTVLKMIADEIKTKDQTNVEMEQS